MRIVAGLIVCAAAVAGAGWALPAQQRPTDDGAVLYRTYCASCHGTSGRGDGPLGKYLRVPATDLTHLAERHGGRFQEDAVARVIDGRARVGPHGPSDMPVWGDAFSSALARGGEARLRERIAALVRYLGSIQQQPAP